MTATAIEWADRVWNPLVGCSIASPGCANCYAMKEAARIERMDKALGGRLPHYHGLTREVNGKPVWTGEVRAAPQRTLMLPLDWMKPARVFVNSMSDLFHEDVPDHLIDRVFSVMAVCPHLTFIVVTKRGRRMRDYCLKLQQQPERLGAHRGPESQTVRPLHSIPLPNVWLLVSAERQAEANERIPFLLETPAARRGVSLEPMLALIDLVNIGGGIDALRGERFIDHYDDRNTSRRVRTIIGKLPPLDWVITGFENGPRPGHPDWVRAVRDQCAPTNTAFFHKQNGTWRVVADLDKDDPGGGRAGDIARRDPKGRWLNLAGGHGFHGERVLRVTPTTKRNAGALLDGVLHREFPR